MDHAVPMAGAAKKAFPDLRALGFDRACHSPGNRVRPAGMPGCSTLPGKGYLNGAERGRQQADLSAMRQVHPAVESATDSLGHRGSDRALVFGAGGFGRTVALAVVATARHLTAPPPGKRRSFSTRVEWERHPLPGPSRRHPEVEQRANEGIPGLRRNPGTGPVPPSTGARPGQESKPPARKRGFSGGH